MQAALVDIGFIQQATSALRERLTNMGHSPLHLHGKFLLLLLCMCSRHRGAFKHQCRHWD